MTPAIYAAMAIGWALATLSAVLIYAAYRKADARADHNAAWANRAEARAAQAKMENVLWRGHAEKIETKTRDVDVHTAPWLAIDLRPIHEDMVKLLGEVRDPIDILERMPDIKHPGAMIGHRERPAKPKPVWDNDALPREYEAPAIRDLPGKPAGWDEAGFGKIPETPLIENLRRDGHVRLEDIKPLAPGTYVHHDDAREETTILTINEDRTFTLETKDYDQVTLEER